MDSVVVTGPEFQCRIVSIAHYLTLAHTTLPLKQIVSTKLNSFSPFIAVKSGLIHRK